MVLSDIYVVLMVEIAYNKLFSNVDNFQFSVLDVFVKLTDLFVLI